MSGTTYQDFGPGNEKWWICSHKGCETLEYASRTPLERCERHPSSPMVLADLKEVK